MKKIPLIVLVQSVLIHDVVFASQENGFSYDYVEGGYAYWDIDTGSKNFHYNAGVIKAVNGIFENVHIFSSYTDAKQEQSSGDHNLELKTIGVGLNHPLYYNTDITVDFSHTWWGSSRDDWEIEGGFNTVDAVVRYYLEEGLELTAGIQRNDFTGSDTLYSGASIGAIKKISKDLSINLNIAKLRNSQSSNEVDWVPVFLGVRHYY